MKLGSSPRVRGKRHEGVGGVNDDGLIPARAGKTFQPAPRPLRGAAHPRACGENTPPPPPPMTPVGSSPRVRGKRADRCAGQPRLGLIPARAGKTHRAPPPRTSRTAHPRACGENPTPRRAEVWAEGSSPRVRGKPPGLTRGAGQRGLIPARAGKTRARTPGPAPPTAHPRACGENR